MHTATIQPQCFDHLLKLDSITFPPPEPRAGEQWVVAGAGLRATPERHAGYFVEVPGRKPVFVLTKERADNLHRYITSHLRAATYLSELEGNLIDWRAGKEGRILRQNYSAIHAIIRNGADLKATLRAIPSQPYQASMYFATATGGCQCPDCVLRDYHLVVHSIRYETADDWHVIGFRTLWNNEIGEETTCDSCCRIIEPVYGE